MTSTCFTSAGCTVPWWGLRWRRGGRVSRVRCCICIQVSHFFFINLKSHEIPYPYLYAKSKDPNQPFAIMAIYYLLANVFELSGLPSESITFRSHWQRKELSWTTDVPLQVWGEFGIIFYSLQRLKDVLISGMNEARASLGLSRWANG